MEGHRTTQTGKMIVKRKRTPTVAAILDEIRQEYCLKRNNFNPKGSSPNIFVSKLQWRMKTYYKDLYSSFSLDTK